MLDEHVPIKRKYTCANDGRFMTKALRKTRYSRSGVEEGGAEGGAP